MVKNSFVNRAVNVTVRRYMVQGIAGLFMIFTIVLKRGGIPVNGEEAVKTVKIVLAAYESERREIELC